MSKVDSKGPLLREANRFSSTRRSTCEIPEPGATSDEETSKSTKPRTAELSAGESTDTVGGVVWSADRVDQDRAELQGLPGPEMLQVVDGSQISAHGPVGHSSHIHGQPKLAMVDARTAHVVGMVVGNQQGIDLVDVATMLGHALLGHFSADARVEQ